MLQRITHRAADLVELLGVEGRLLTVMLSRSAGLVGVLVVVCLVGAVGLVGLAAAAVVALAASMGTAGAIALVSALVLIGAGLAGAAVWSMMLAMHRGQKLTEAEQRLKSQREHLVAELKAPEPPPPAPANPFPSLPSINLGKIDPVLVLAGVGAATAVLGPRRMFKIVGSLAGNMAVLNSVVSAAKAAASGASASAGGGVGHNGFRR
ncbi:MAG: hypothetical protein K2Q09_00530 [Phycisphaerales bacterium]|nr:hypothetical protein [Phycisphaerales bacterium]